MTNQKLLDYAEEFSFSGIGHLLGFGLTSTMLAVAGAPNAALAALALSGISLLGHGAARGAKELYEFLSNDGKKLKLSDETNDNIKYFLQAGIYTVFASLAVFAYFAAVGASLPIAGGVAGIIGGSILMALTIAKFAPDMWQGFCDLVGWKASKGSSNDNKNPNLTKNKKPKNPSFDNDPTLPTVKKDVPAKDPKQPINLDSNVSTDQVNRTMPIPRSLLSHSNQLLDLYFEGSQGGQVPSGLQRAFDSRFGIIPRASQGLIQPTVATLQANNEENNNNCDSDSDNEWILVR